MKNIQLNSVLLFALIVPFIMSYRIGPSETPYWLFGIIFFLLFLYILLDIFAFKEKINYFLKHIVLWITIITVLGSAFVSAIIVRHQTHPIYMIHDIVLQQEAAIQFLLHGKNPYSSTYFGTPLEEWHYSDKDENPALYHFVMQPFYLIFSIPFYLVSNRIFGYFDGRMPLMFLFLLLIITAYILIKDKKNKLLFVILLTLNPAMLGYTLEGRSDIFMYTFLFLGLYLLFLGKYSLAGVLIALSFGVKQSVWPILPLYFAYIYFQARSVKKSLRHISLFVVTLVVIIFPFVLWDSKAYLDSTIGYLSGSVPHSYPISGYGIGMVLQQFGVIENGQQYYPFYIWQLIIGLPVMILLLKYLKRSPSVKRLLVTYSVFLFVFWYFSRYFNNSHIGYLSLLFISAYFFPEKDNSTIQKNT